MNVETKILCTLLYDLLHVPPVVCDAAFLFWCFIGCFFPRSRLGLLQFWHLIIDL